MVEENGVYKK